MRGGESTSCERAKTGLLAPRRPPRRGTETLRAECAHAPSHRTPRSRRRTLCACPCPALTTHKLRQLSARPKTKRGATKTVASWAVASGVGLRAPCRAGPSSPCQSWRTSSASVPAHAQAEVSSRSALGSAHARPAPEQRRALFARSVLWGCARAGARRAKVAGGERGGGGLSRASHGGLWCFVFVRTGRTDEDCSSWTLRGGQRESRWEERQTQSELFQS